MKRTAAVLAQMLLLALCGVAQKTEIFSVSDVTAGSKKLETRYFYAMGKWSDAGPDVGISSTEIHCYARFGFCEVASAYSMGGQAQVNFDSYNILRWDAQEMIAVDSSTICIVNTVRVDFVAKKVSISSTSKGKTDNRICKEMESTMPGTAFLIGTEDALKRIETEHKKNRRHRQ